MASTDLEVSKQKQQVTLIAALANLGLAVAKVAAGLLSNSAALVADGLHSFSDLASDFLTYYTVFVSSKQADEQHPYGHGRFETIASVLLGLLLLAVAAGICWDAFASYLQNQAKPLPGTAALVITAISIAVNELLYQYTAAVGRKTRSRLMLANAWHHRSDALSSIVVIIGLFMALAGWPNADAVAAFIVGLMVAKIAIQLILESAQELVDSGLPPDQLAAIREEVLQTEGVQALHMLRTRMMGGDVLVDLHIIVDPYISVSEGHVIGDLVRYRLRENFAEISDVLIHVDCEDDRKGHWDRLLLTRTQLLEGLKQSWKNQSMSDQLLRIGLHYRHGKIELELYFPIELLNQREALESVRMLVEMTKNQQDFVSEVRVYYTDPPTVRRQ